MVAGTVGPGAAFFIRDLRVDCDRFGMITRPRNGDGGWRMAGNRAHPQKPARELAMYKLSQWAGSPQCFVKPFIFSPLNLKDLNRLSVAENYACLAHSRNSLETNGWIRISSARSDDSIFRHFMPVYEVFVCFSRFLMENKPIEFIS